MAEVKIILTIADKGENIKDTVNAFKLRTGESPETAVEKKAMIKNELTSIAKAIVRKYKTAQNAIDDIEIT